MMSTPAELITKDIFPDEKLHLLDDICLQVITLFKLRIQAPVGIQKMQFGVQQPK